MFIIDKIFNLKIDTKNKNISTVNGLKQFDNNSVLNITLLQNSLALDLSNCTVRINFLREDNKVLLYMADIVSPKEGQVSIKLSPEVLEKTGNIKTDISVFDSNLLKITSTTFNMKVDKTIYNDTYFTNKDLDLMQQEYVREKERQKAESARSENELERITKEGQRNSNENTRNSNEEARRKAENSRVTEWNNVKKDATNIKNTLDTTIDTANKTKDNLQNTIATGDKLKQELTPQNYVKNSDYEAYKKEVTTQYEDLPNKFTLRNAGKVDDFNNMTTQNEYLVGSDKTIPNAPYNTNIYGKLFVYLNDGSKYNGSTNWIWQIFINTYGIIYKRQKINSMEWTSWVQLPSRNEITAINKRLDAIEQALIEKGFNIAKNRLNI